MIRQFRSFRSRRVLPTLSTVVLLAASAAAQRVCLTAVLDAAQETPPNASAGKGTAFMLVDRAANTLTYAICFDGLGSAENSAHIHGFAAPGAMGGVKYALPLGKFKSGVLTYPEADEANILAGLLYVNIHTFGFPLGEIRGQLERSSAPQTLTCVADGLQETPPSPSSGKGVGWFKFNTAANTFSYSFTYASLGAAETAAHLHGFAAPGAAAGIKFALPVGFHKNGLLAYPGADEASYLAGLSYVNIHTSALPGGEIRGQIVPGTSNPTSYCTSKVNSSGCQALVGSTGLPTLGGPDDFHVTCSGAINNNFGIMFWSANGTAAAPFFGGTMCVKPPLIRSPVLNSGGTPLGTDCSGTFDFAFTDAYMAANGLTPGNSIYCEFWYRDPADPFTVSTSDALYAEIL